MEVPPFFLRINEIYDGMYLLFYWLIYVGIDVK